MIYGSLQAEFMETKYNSHIHGYGTSVFRQIYLDGLILSNSKYTHTAITTRDCYGKKCCIRRNSHMRTENICQILEGID